MTLDCQKCGVSVEDDEDIIFHHKECWVEFQQETIAIARGEKWHKLEGSETTEYYED